VSRKSKLQTDAAFSPAPVSASESDAASNPSAPVAKRPSALRFAIPLVVFALLVFFLWRGLWRDPREVPSVLVNKPAPAFTLPVLGAAGKTFSPPTTRAKCGC
jgi:hypothetical protein